MRLVVNAIVAFGFSKKEVMWGMSFAFLNWMMMEYSEMHGTKEEKPNKARQEVIEMMKKTGHYHGS